MEENRAEVKLNLFTKLKAHCARLGYWLWLALASVGTLAIIVLLATNKTVNGGRRYLYPLIPFDGRALLTLLVRRKKQSDIHASNKR